MFSLLLQDGCMHLGPGILLAEIQQTSDVTYRIYDWDRIDHAGMMRELHTDLALDALDFNLLRQLQNSLYRQTERNSKIGRKSLFYYQHDSSK